MDISPDPGPLLAAAIVAALSRVEEERRAAAAIPPERPVPGRWVAAGLAKSVPTPPTVRRPVRRQGEVSSD
ncbi:MAG TPA: hypothetical protein VFY15_05825 [Acidimicrobiia bacterium]|nr:hypothetical protein [Acidimicrobiia bacterium]